MLDDHSLQVTYRKDRGEPRGAHKKSQSWEGRGDCVDCEQCLVVCPMGIDIRNGSQLECINCGLCVDACDEIMVRVDRPTGLIGYDTDAAVAAHACGQKPEYKFVRARTIYYGSALAIVSALMLWGLSTRSEVVFDVLRDRNPTFVRLHDGSVRDGYTLKIANRSFERRDFHIDLTGLPGATLKTPGAPLTTGGIVVSVDPNQVQAVRLLVAAPSASLTQRSLPVTFSLKAGKVTAQAQSTFLSADAAAS
jgi:cytochrome c oxidase accessory protein FixG